MKNYFIVLLLGAFLVLSGCGKSTEDTLSPDGNRETASADAFENVDSPSLPLFFETDGDQESIIRPNEIVAIAVQNQNGDTVELTDDQAVELLKLFSEAESREFLYPTHPSAQMSDPVYVINISFSDGQEDVLYSTERGARFFYRFTGTYGEQGDQGYVLAENPMFEDFFEKLGF